MTKDYALYLLNKLCIGASVEAMPIIPQFELSQALSVAIKALEQDPCEDAISREAVLKIIEKKEFKGDAIYGIERLPSVTPKAESKNVLEKIRAEIMQLDYDIESIYFDYNDREQIEVVHTICREEVLQIIDKYKAESEE